MTRGTADANGLSLLLLLLSHLRSILLLRSTLRHPVLIATTGTKLVACHRGLVLHASVRLSLLVLLSHLCRILLLRPLSRSVCSIFTEPTAATR